MINTLYLADREEDSFQRHCRLSAFLTKGNITIFDVGANRGQSINCYREKFPNCSITSFEPNPATFSLLEKTWGDVHGVTLNPVALTSYTGNASFYATRVSEASSLLPPTEQIIELSSEHKYDHETINVPTMTLDHYCQSNNTPHIDILKLDTQGAELSIMEGAVKLLQEGNISVIYSEVIFAETYKGQTSLTDLMSYLEKYNYKVWDISPFLYTRNERIWAANVLFLHVDAACRVENEYKDY